MPKTTPDAVNAAIKEFTDAKKPIPFRLRFLKARETHREIVGRMAKVKK